MKLPVWAPFAVVGVAVLWLKFCHDPAVRRDARADTSADSLDAVVRVLRVDLAEAESVNVIRRSQIANLTRENAVVRVERARLNVVLDSLKVVVTGFDSLVPRSLVASLLAVQDSVTSGLLAENRQITEQRDLWRAVALSRDTSLQSAATALTAMERQRDDFRRRVPSATERWATFGGGALVGYGLAEQSETIVLVGAVTVLAPRVVAFVGRIF